MPIESIASSSHRFSLRTIPVSQLMHLAAAVALVAIAIFMLIQLSYAGSPTKDEQKKTALNAQREAELLQGRIEAITTPILTELTEAQISKLDKAVAAIDIYHLGVNALNQTSTHIEKPIKELTEKMGAFVLDCLKENIFSFKIKVNEKKIQKLATLADFDFNEEEMTLAVELASSEEDLISFKDIPALSKLIDTCFEKKLKHPVDEHWKQDLKDIACLSDFICSVEGYNFKSRDVSTAWDFPTFSPLLAKLQNVKQVFLRRKATGG